MAKKKNPAAVALGKIGGKARVPKGFTMMTPEQRKQNGIKGAQKRWGKKKVKKVMEQPTGLTDQDRNWIREQLERVIDGLKSGIDSQFDGVDARFNGIDARFDRVAGACHTRARHQA